MLFGKKKKEDSERSDEEDDNKEDNSNINTEGMNTVETRKLNFKKKENEGLLILRLRPLLIILHFLSF